MSTRAIKFLKQQKIPFEVITYDHKEKGAEFAAMATGFPLKKTVKTLVVDLGNKKYGMALMPGDRQLDLKAFAKAATVKKAVMADTGTAERITGYLVGGISPFGTKQRIPCIMEHSLMNFDKVMINAGHRGTMLLISPKNIVKALGCPIGKIARK